MGLLNIAVFALTSILTISIAFPWYILRQSFHAFYIRKRMERVLIVELSLITLLLLIFVADQSLIILSIESFMITRLVQIIILVLIDGLLFVLSMRLIRFYIKLHMSKAMYDQAWRKNLDPGRGPDFLTYNSQRVKTIGWTLAAIAVAVTFLIQSSIAFSIPQDRKPNIRGRWVLGLSTGNIVWIGLAYYVFTRIPEIEDGIHIRSETLWTGVVWSIAPVVSIFLGITSTGRIRGPSGRLVYGVAIALQSISLTLTAYMSTVYVTYSNNQSAESVAYPRKLGWMHLISFEQGYHSFAQFLVGEFAIESLMFLTELMQLKLLVAKFHERLFLKSDGVQFLQVQNLVRDDSRSATKSFSTETQQKLLLSAKNFDVNLPHELPHSTLLEMCRSPEEMLFWLFKKYVDPGEAPLEINIDSRTRNKLVKQFGQVSRVSFGKMRDRILSGGYPPSNSIRVMQNQDMLIREIGVDSETAHTYRRQLENIDFFVVLDSFDSAGKQLASLLTDSFTRFVSTKEFKYLWSVHKDLLLAKLEGTDDAGVLLTRSVSAEVTRIMGAFGAE